MTDLTRLSDLGAAMIEWTKLSGQGKIMTEKKTF